MVPWLARAARATVFASAASIVLSLAPAARADDTADEAQIHFDLGMEYARKGDYRHALEQFLQSNRLAPNKNVVFNIAQNYEALDQFPDAFRYYASALESEKEPAARQPIEEAIQRISPKVALLDVVTEPAGATLYLNRRDLGGRGTSPRVLGLSAGRYTVIADLAEYESAESDAVDLAVGKRAQVRLRLRRILGTVRVEGAAVGAAVRADSEASEILCTVPCEPELPPGRHTILVSREGFQTAEAPVDVVANGTVVVRPKLTPLLGSIVVSSDTRGATIAVDGHVEGFTPTVLSVPVGRHHVVVSQPGFKSIERDVAVTMNAQEQMNAVLAPVESPLDLSIETASRASEKQSRAPAITTVWTARQIATTPARTVQDVLKLLPGIDTFDLPDEGRHLAGVRGISSGSILVLVDGQRLNTSLEAPVNIDLPLENIERIELIRGPGSTLYGTYAFTGVLNIVTKKPAQTEGLVARYRAGVRGVESHMSTRENRISANAGHTIGQLALGGFFLLSEDQGMHALIESDSESERRRRLAALNPGRFNAQPLAVPAVSAPGYTREWARNVEVDANADYASTLSYKGKLFLTDKEPIVGRAYALNDGTILGRTRVLQSLEAQHTLTHASRAFPSTKIDVRYFFDFYRSKDRFQDQPRGWDPGFSAEFGQVGPVIYADGKRQDIAIDYVSNLAEAKLDQVIRLRAKAEEEPDLLLTLGAAVEDQRLTRARSFANYGRTYVVPGQLPTERYEYLPTPQESELFRRPGAQPDVVSYHADNFLPSRFIVAAYAQGRWDLTSWLTATAGARFDHFSDFGGVVNPRGALVFAPSDAFFVKALYGRAFNAPSFTNLYLATPEQTTAAGNPALRAETIDTYEVQVGLQSDRFRVVANAYVFRIADLIRRISVLRDFSGEQFHFDNVAGASTGYGGELETRFVISETLSTFANASLQRIVFDVATSLQADIPPQIQTVILPMLKGTTGVNWEAVKNVAFGATIIAASVRTQRDEFPAGSVFREASAAPAYVLFNASVLVDKIFDRAYAKATVMDAFNSNYRDYVLSLPMNLPRFGTELYLEAGVRAF